MFSHAKLTTNQLIKSLYSVIPMVSQKPFCTSLATHLTARVLQTHVAISPKLSRAAKAASQSSMPVPGHLRCTCPWVRCTCLCPCCSNGSPSPLDISPGDPVRIKQLLSVHRVRGDATAGQISGGSSLAIDHSYFRFGKCGILTT